MTDKTITAATPPPPPRGELTPAPVDHGTIDLMLAGGFHDPHSILGAHPSGGVVTVRTLRPHATTVEVEVGSQRYPMTHVHQGVWAAALPGDMRARLPHPGRLRRRAPRWSTTPTATCRRSARSTST